MWAPLEVSDFDAADAFYGTALGLPRLASWERDGERGVVFGVGTDARLEIVSPAAPISPPRVALELPTWADVDELAARLGERPAVFPRGHYGFVARDPDGKPILLWSERT